MQSSALSCKQASNSDSAWWSPSNTLLTIRALLPTSTLSMPTYLASCSSFYLPFSSISIERNFQTSTWSLKWMMMTQLLDVKIISSRKVWALNWISKRKLKNCKVNSMKMRKFLRLSKQFLNILRRFTQSNKAQLDSHSRRLAALL